MLLYRSEELKLGQSYKLNSSPQGRLGGAFSFGKLGEAWIFLILILCFSQMAEAQDFCFVELNCENLFDTTHDDYKNDMEFTPEGTRRWTRNRYNRKLNNIARELIACGGQGDEWQLPDLVALVEVENDTVLHDLTRRSLLKKARYDYVMTESKDLRGIDVALLYNKVNVSVVKHYPIRVMPGKGERPTRDILYALCSTSKGNIHTFVVHAPSRSGGKTATDPYRMKVAKRLCLSIDSIMNEDASAKIIVAGDFNDYHSDPAPQRVVASGMVNVSAGVEGSNGAKGTYRFRGEWGSLDQIFVSESMHRSCKELKCNVFDAIFLMEEETKYGGFRPRRSFNGPSYDREGYSDHLPLILRWK